MVLASEILASSASDENLYHPNNNFIHAYSSDSQETIPIKPNCNTIYNKPERKSNKSKLLKEKTTNWNSRGRSCRNKMQNSTSKSNPEESSTGRSLKMRIKKKPGANKSGEKHEIVNNSCDSDKAKAKAKRGRVRIKSGNSSSECDPYEFSAKTDDDELPIKRIKLDAIHESPATREVGINAVTLGTMTEPDLLGACEPGTRICLNGIVWLETDTGLLVINVTWRGRTYVGTLLDSTKHDFAPPCPRDYVSPIESRTYSRGRGKRRGTTFQQSYRNGRGSAKTRGLGRTAPISETTTPTDSDDDTKRNRSRRLSPSNSTADSELNSDSNYPIECLQQDCSKRFADITALSFHMNQTHLRKQTRKSFLSSDDARSNGPSRPRSLEAPFHFKSGDEFTNDSSPCDSVNDTLLNSIAVNNLDAKVVLTDSTNDKKLFKTPSALSMNTVNNSIHSNKALSPNSPNPSLSSNSSASDASAFSFSTVTSSNMSINHSKSVGNSPSQIPRVVTAHTVTIPLDKSPASPISPPKKKCDEQKKYHKKSSTSNLTTNVINNKSPITLPANCQNDTKTYNHSFNSLSTSIIDNSLLSTQPSSKSPAINLKLIQPKPQSQNLPFTPKGRSDSLNRSNSQTDKRTKPKKPRTKDLVEKSNANTLKPMDLKVNGYNHGENQDSFENPASPAYSDISNDSPAPVLEKEVDVKSQVDRSESCPDSEVIVGHRNNTETANYLFSQPPSLVPAVVASDKNSIQQSSTSINDNLDTVTKSSLEDKTSPNNCLSNDKRSVALDFSKKEPPALTKLPDNNKALGNSSSINASYNNKPGRENVSPIKHCSSEVSSQSSRSDNKLTSQSYSVNNLSRSIESSSIPTPTTSAFNNMTPADYSNLSRLYDPNYLHSFHQVNSLQNGLAYNHSMVQSALASHIKAPSSQQQHKIHELVDKTTAHSPSSSSSSSAIVSTLSNESNIARLNSPLTTISSGGGERGGKSPAEIPIPSHNLRPPAHHPFHLQHLVSPFYLPPGHSIHQSSPSFPDSFASPFLLPPNGTSAASSHSLLFNHK